MLVNLFTRTHNEQVKQRADRKAVCSHCGREFRNKSYLIRHLQTHEDRRQVRCPQCARSFKNNEVLRVHRRQHHTENPSRLVMFIYRRRCYHVTKYILSRAKEFFVNYPLNEETKFPHYRYSLDSDGFKIYPSTLSGWVLPMVKILTNSFLPNPQMTKSKYIRRCIIYSVFVL